MGLKLILLTLDAVAALPRLELATPDEKLLAPAVLARRANTLRQVDASVPVLPPLALSARFASSRILDSIHSAIHSCAASLVDEPSRATVALLARALAIGATTAQKLPVWALLARRALALGAAAALSPLVVAAGGEGGALAAHTVLCRSARRDLILVFETLKGGLGGGDESVG